MKLSATIIVCNEERHLPRCLNSLKDVADEIIVVDSGSTDRTLMIAEGFGARIFPRAFTNYADQKNYACMQAAHEWILSLDADECLSEQLRERIIDLKKGSPVADAYEFPRRAFYLGRWIHYSGWYPDYKVRLFCRTKAHWEGQFVHESVTVNGRISIIDADLLHYTCDSISEHLERLDHYTTLAAAELHQKGRKSSLSGLLISPWAAFLRAYFVRTGFLDGYQGLIIAVFAAYYNFLKYVKLWEVRRVAKELGGSGK
jgi:glycosyltransferase involved in cell wall biosynthesis